MLERPRAPWPYDFLPKVPEFTVVSDDVRDGEMLAETHAQTGEDVSPHLNWSGFPAETKSFAVTCFDPDAPTGSGFWHWAVANIPVSTTQLERDAAMPGGAVELRNDLSAVGYVGAAPPAGDFPHRYMFTVHAVDVEQLSITAEATPAFLAFNLAFHTVGRAVVTPVYQIKA